MKILMFGWEYAPQHTGGLGVACKALADEMSKRHDVSFILPSTSSKKSLKSENVDIQDASAVKKQELKKAISTHDVRYLDLEVNLLPYLSPDIFKNDEQKEIKVKQVDKNLKALQSIPLTGTYNKNLTAEVTKYTLAASTLYEDEEYDLIHAHDWMGLNAGMLAKAILKIPLIAHVHSLETDRTGAAGSNNIKALEKKGLHIADAIICVSDKTKNDIIKNYHISSEKITVVPNATNWRNSKAKTNTNKPLKIGFLGRMTHQKAPEKFVDLARALENITDNYEYIMIGDGYMTEDIANKIVKLNLLHKMKMTGFLNPDEVKLKLKHLALLVIPSVSEPFGLVALEATAKGIPVIISENAGVNEFIPFKTFRSWDIHQMKKLVISLTENSCSNEEYITDCQAALRKLNWKNSAQKIEKLYKHLSVDK